MFTGIVEEIGHVEDIRRGAASARLSVSAPLVSSDARIGDSICVSGVCLTIVGRHDGTLVFDAVPETLRRSSLRDLSNGSPANLERALRADGRLGGHIVQGHVDGVGRIASIAEYDNSRILTVAVPPDLRRYTASKGSVAIDGISLTVAGVQPEGFTVAVIPHTWEMTTLKYRRVGDAVNLETDILAKYVERLLGHDTAPPERLSVLLADAGYLEDPAR